MRERIDKGIEYTEKCPILPQELQEVSKQYKIGDRFIKKEVFLDKDNKRAVKHYNCVIIQKTRNGLILKKNLHKDVTIATFISYTELAMEARRKTEKKED